MWTEEDATTEIVCHKKLDLVERKRDSTEWMVHPKANCLGSICSAWRWADYVNNNNEEHFRSAAPPGSILGEPLGYCALLGVPQDEIEARP